MQPPAHIAPAPMPSRNDLGTPLPGRPKGVRARLRRSAVMSASVLAPRLAAAHLARRYLTADQAVIVDLAHRKHRFGIVPLGEDTAILRMAARHLPDNGPRVLVLPGHDGHFRQFTRVARALQKRGGAVDMLIFPGHAHRSSGLCSLRHMVGAILRATRQQGPYNGIVAHCVGSNALLHALEEGQSLANRLALISVPLDLPALVRLGGRQYGLNGRCLDHFVRHVDAIGAPYALGHDWQPLARSRSEGLLIVQARNDYAAPLENLRPLAETWPGARLEVFEQGDHNGILNVTSAIRAIAEFIVPGD